MIELSTLQNIPLFEGLDDKQLKKIQRALRTVTAKTGDVIIRDGEKGEEMYVVLEGEVQISKPLTPNPDMFEIDQQDKSIIRLGAHNYSFFGEMALLDIVSKRMANVTATKKSVFAVLRKGEFDLLIKDDISFGYRVIYNIAKILSSRLGKANQDIIKLAVAFSLALEK